LLNVGVAGESGSRVGSVVSASSILSSVGIGAFSVNSLVGDDVGHCISHETTIASLISLAPRAINEVLFREAHQLLLRNEVATLSGSSGGEGPATSTLLLVLDGSNGSFLVPVPGGREGGGGGGGALVLVSSGNFHSQIDSSVLSIGEVSKLIHGESDSCVSGVVVVDVVEVLAEELISVLELIVAIGFLEFLHPVGKLGLVLLVSESISASNQKSNNNEELHLFC